jgi:hypothetical protein
MSGEIILVFSFVFAVCAAIFTAAPAPAPWYVRVHLGWLAFACFIAYLLFGAFGHGPLLR